MNKKKIGLIGVGLMGYPMGLNWLNKDFYLSVLPNKNLDKIRQLSAKGAHVSKNMEELVADSDVIILMLPTSKEVEAVTNELLSFVKPKHLVIDMTTSEPHSTVKIYEKFKSQGLRFFDSPVTGGVKGATEGALTLFVGGPKEYFEETKEVLCAVSKLQKHFGAIGNGHVAKVINNYICIGNLAVFSEALPLAVKLGLNASDIFETTQSGTGASKMLDLYGEQILNADFAPRFKMEHALKDLKIADSIAKGLGITLPVLEGMLKDFDAAQKQGYLSENISALIRPIENKLGAFFRKK